MCALSFPVAQRCEALSRKESVPILKKISLGPQKDFALSSKYNRMPLYSGLRSCRLVMRDDVKVYEKSKFLFSFFVVVVVVAVVVVVVFI